MRIIALALAAALAAASGDAASKDARVSSEVRRDAIRRAQVWTATAVASMDLRSGPAGADAFAPDALVTCTYTPHPRKGNTPKFHCRLPDGDVVKVKYGVTNGEVYAEVLATRLLWALGFGADREYPVRVSCRGCSADPWTQDAPVRGEHLFDIAAIERPFTDRLIETRDDSGWKWAELDMVDESQGGAPRAHRDALTLLAVLLQHTDSKAAQQRLACLDPRDEDTAPDAACASPFMYINDLGLTFGAANTWNRNAVGSTNLDRWRGAPVWKDAARCIGNLTRSATGSLENPRISEAGRAFLAGLLARLSDAQLVDLFTVARVERRSSKATVGDWVGVFKQKRDEIASTRCPE